MPLIFRSLVFCACVCLSLSASAQAPDESATTRKPSPPANELPSLLPPDLALTRERPLEIQDDFPPLTTIDLTASPDDLWQRVRNGFSMPNLDSPLVAERQAWYLNRPEMLKHVLDRSRRYLYYIVDELEKRGMPTELALLPVVESAYNPMAYSSARASGIWQFIPSTGKNYRLEQNWWLDQRRDIVASTGAALDYLQTIYEMHGDWHLALASYNWGEHAVARAVAKNQAKQLPTDYAHLTMPAETRYYVPKLQALKNIIAQPQLFGIRLNVIPNQPYFDLVGKPADMDLSVAAKLAETPLDEFMALNPSYNRPVMPGSKGSPLVLPAGKVQTFLVNLQHHENQEKPLTNWHTYKLKKGEKLEKVAARFNITTAYLKQINGITRRTRVTTGTTLLVPRKTGQTSANLHEVNLPLTPPDLPKMQVPKNSKKGSKKPIAKAGKAKKPAGKSAKSGKKKPAKRAPAKPLSKG